ncbi:hypothetical protein II906_08090, partial [bacterium]|nr:hypothetical protein [bacterium]
ANPSEIIIDSINNKAYIASIEDESLTTIDLNNFTVKEKIQLLGAPQRLSLNEDGTAIAYVDMKTSNVYYLNLSGEYENKLITNYPNATKLILKHNALYLISRTQPALRIVYYDLMQDNQTIKSKKTRDREEYNKELERKNSEDFNADIITQYESIKNSKKYTEEEIIARLRTYSTSIKDVDISPKPVDMYMKDGIIYVLCAGDNTVYTYNTQTEEVSSSNLPVEGFSRAFTPVPNSNLAVVSNVSALKYAIYDMDAKKPLQTVPISDYINMITILERYNER